LPELLLTESKTQKASAPLSAEALENEYRFIRGLVLGQGGTGGVFSVIPFEV
jgi:hypothetical protein